MPFMRYVLARYGNYQREEAYRVCVTECLKLVSENTGMAVGGKQYTGSYYEFAHKPAQEEETRSAEEVIENIRNTIANIGGNA